MHEQEFERSVQQKMEDLSFTPSAPVWEKVAAEIQGQRKKRRLAFWLLPFGLAGVMLGIYYLQQGLGTEPPVEISGKDVSKAPAVPNKAAQAKVPIISAPAALPATATANLVPRKSSARQNNSGTNQYYNGGTNAPLAQPPVNTVSPDPEVVISGSANAIIGDPVLAEQRIVPPIPLSTADRMTGLGATINNETLTSVGDAPIRAGVRKKWAWSLQLNYGRSHMATQSFLSPASQDFSSNPAGQWQNGAGAPFFPVSPLQVEGGPFTAVQLGLRKKISTRWYLQTGLQYARYTQRVGVGRMVPAPGSNRSQNFYEPGNAGTYVNRFHQVAVPLSFQYKPFRKFPLELEAGIAPAYLLSAQTLRLDTATRLYTEQKPAVRALQLPVSAGMRYRLAQSHSFEWLGGVHFQYHLTGMYNRNYAPRLFALSAGIQVRKK